MAHKHIILKLKDGITNTTPALVKEVKFLQKTLKDWGVYPVGESVDGKFGAKTEQAVKDFQSKRNLEADGIVGQNTWAALLKVSSQEIEIISVPASGKVGAIQINLNAIPTIWKPAATPLVPTLVNAFHDQGIVNPVILAFACAAICHESSWRTDVENKTDAAAHTGYPGRGLAQVTWKDNYKAVGKATGIDFVGNPDFMFDPYKSLRAKAAFYQINEMINYIAAGDYESAAGKYNAGSFGFRSDYTRKVSADTPKWIPVFSVS